MRASEFISESKVGKISNRQQYATRGLNILYDLNRLMMAVASSDGVNPIVMDAESWVGKHNTTHPYTKEEQDMLKLAYKAANLEYIDLNNGDMDSEELPGTNAQSIVKPFKGYKRK